MDQKIKKPVFFNRPCPDCGDYIDTPDFIRDNYAYSVNGKLVSQPVCVQCPTCGWRTNNHDTVQECADEWNSTKI